MSKSIANLLFVIATIGWGSSYLFTKFAVEELTPFAIIAYRFGIAFIVTACIFHKRLNHISKQTWKASAILGSLLFIVFLLFGYTMQLVSPSTAGFLVATTVVLVPLVSVFFTKKLPSRQIVIGGSVVFVGLMLFSLKGQLAIEFGAVLALMMAFFFALHIVVNNYFAKTNDALQLGILQLGFAGVLGFICMLLFEEPTKPATTRGWLSILLLAIVCSAFGFVVQSVAQKYTTAEETGFILALEPLFAAIFSFIAIGEVLSAREWLGALLIFTGVLLANYMPKRVLLWQIGKRAS